MWFLLILLILYSVNSSLLFNLRPRISYHYKGDVLTLICDPSNISKSLNWSLFYETNTKIYAIQSTEIKRGYVKGVIKDTKRLSRIIVVCNNSEQNEFGIGHYTFIDKIDKVIDQIGQPTIKCQHFGGPIACCVTASAESIMNQMQLFSLKDVQLTFTVNNINLKPIEYSKLRDYGMDMWNRYKINTTCYMGQILYVPIFSPRLSIKVPLVDNTYELKFPNIFQSKILKPPKPKIILNNRAFVLTIDLYFTSHYEINVTCVSDYPVPKRSTRIQNATKKYRFDFSHDEWLPHARIICTAFSKLSLLENISELARIDFSVYESVPNKGPNIILRKLNKQYRVCITDIDPIDRNGVIIKYKIKCTFCSSNSENIILPTKRIIPMKLTNMSTISVAGCTKKGCAYNEVKVDQMFDDNYQIISGLVKVNNIIFWWFDKSNISSGLSSQTHNQFKIYLLECFKQSNLGDTTCTSVKQYLLNVHNYTTYGRFKLNTDSSNYSKLYSLAVYNSFVTKWVDCNYKYTKPGTEGFSRILTKSRAINIKQKCGFSNCYLYVKYNRPSCYSFPLFYITQVDIKIRNKVTKIDVRDKDFSETKILISVHGLKLEYTVEIYTNSLEPSNYTFYKEIKLKTEFVTMYCLILVIAISVIPVLIVFWFVWKTIKKWRKKKFDKPTFKDTPNRPPRTLNENNEDENFPISDPEFMMGQFESKSKRSTDYNYTTIDQSNGSKVSHSPTHQGETADTSLSSSSQSSDSFVNCSSFDPMDQSELGYKARPNPMNQSELNYKARPNPMGQFELSNKPQSNEGTYTDSNNSSQREILDYAFVGELRSKQGIADLMVVSQKSFDV